MASAPASLHAPALHYRAREICLLVRTGSHSYSFINRLHALLPYLSGPAAILSFYWSDP